MRKPLLGLFAVLVVLSFSAFPTAAVRNTDKAMLQRLSVTFEQELAKHRPQLYYDLLNNPSPAQRVLNMNPDIQLIKINDRGVPMFYMVDNLNAARTVSTDDVWPGGGAGYNLTGSATTTSQLAIWDGGGVRLTHQELTGRVTQIDSPSGTHPHSTHVSGTMIASGVVANAKGMSYQARLSAYEWNNDTGEMATAAANGLRVSNHSYGYATGWEYSAPYYYWYGDIYVSQTEDYGFGYYSAETQAYDEIAYNAPNYLICKSAGNDRNDFGPGAGGGHYYWDGGWVWGTTTRDPDGGTDMYDCIGWVGNAKNILLVGAVNDIPAGYTQPSDVVQTVFSSWGPTDDGRIKPDIVANGDLLYSCGDASDTAYLTYSGTSMSTPNASGSINLLEDHYTAVTGNQARSATMKAIVIHTADEAGADDGPDYQNGWGLLNTHHAADLIAGESSGIPKIREATLVNGSTDYYHFVVSTGGDPARVTMVWTDPPGTPPTPSLNPTDKLLVDDLDVVVHYIPLDSYYYPWVLDPANPADAATTGDNNTDNVEVVDISSTQPGLYVISVTHKGTLEGGSQDYSIVCSQGLQLGDSPVPTLSEWGLFTLALFLVVFGATLIIRRRRGEV
jgi:hypothetical protein